MAGDSLHPVRRIDPARACPIREIPLPGHLAVKPGVQRMQPGGTLFKRSVSAE
jgi:hypothetical protein